jgi:hypothetical protein
LVPLSVPKVAPSHPIGEFCGIRTLFVFLAFFVIVALTAVPSFGGTKIVHRWVLKDEPMPKLEKILVIAILENYVIRQELEDEMEELLAKSGVTGIKGHLVLPSRDELAEGELKEHIKQGDFDAVLVIRPLSVRTETKEVATSFAGPYYGPPPGYYTLWPYWNMAWTQAHLTSSYIEENTVVSAEFNLYRTKDEKLLWSGETDTVYCKDFKKLGREYARTIVKQLKKDKVIAK